MNYRYHDTPTAQMGLATYVDLNGNEIVGGLEFRLQCPECEHWILVDYRLEERLTKCPNCYASDYAHD